MDQRDKMVGELWKKWFKHTEDNGDAEDGIWLIRKLVEERTLRYQETSHQTRMVDEANHARSSFDIDPEEYEA
jgi:hypothetical protein